MSRPILVECAEYLSSLFLVGMRMHVIAVGLHCMAVVGDQFWQCKTCANTLTEQGI